MVADVSWRLGLDWGVNFLVSLSGFSCAQALTPPQQPKRPAVGSGVWTNYYPRAPSFGRNREIAPATVALTAFWSILHRFYDTSCYAAWQLLGNC